MQVIVNGVSCETQAEFVAELVVERGVNPARVAVVRNESILPAHVRATTRLEAGDRIELLSFASGGSRDSLQASVTRHQ